MLATESLLRNLNIAAKIRKLVIYDSENYVFSLIHFLNLGLILTTGGFDFDLSCFGGWTTPFGLSIPCLARGSVPWLWLLEQ